MLAEQIGNLIKNKRESMGLKQEDLARSADVSRDVVSRLERGRTRSVQSDTVDRLLSALQMNVRVSEAGQDFPRQLARFEQQRVVDQRRERHLRLAVELASGGARDRIPQAKAQIELWRRDKLCSPLYIRKWAKVLKQPPKQMAQAMNAFGDWEAAMFQNSPWI